MKTLEEVTEIYGRKLAENALKLGAIKLSPEKPFTWASGYRMPIYNDNRQFLSHPEYRKTIREAFAEMIKILGIKADNIAGTATAGIPHATSLADFLSLPLSYVRSGAKDHGVGNQIEGLPDDKSYGGANVLLIEDLISTGSSSIKAVEAIRAAGGRCDTCLAIFTYGLDKAAESFAALKPKCSFHTILSYPVMLETAIKTGYLSEKNLKSLKEWRESPFEWGEKHGFAKVEPK